MLRTVNTMAAFTRGQPLAEQLAHHFGRKSEVLDNGELLKDLPVPSPRPSA